MLGVVLNSKVIAISFEDPDGNFMSVSYAIMGQVAFSLRFSEINSVHSLVMLLSVSGGATRMSQISSPTPITLLPSIVDQRHQTL